MSISKELAQRNQNLCELCNEGTAAHSYTVSPRKDDSPENQVALCSKCLQAITAKDPDFHWHFLEGSIWNPEKSVQALSYRILHEHREEDWANNILAAVDIDEDTIQWALSAFEVPEVHADAFGNTLNSGDSVVLTQALNVKGTNFTASKGTVVKKIKLVADNPEQIEGKINDQTIVILTKFVKKS